MTDVTKSGLYLGLKLYHFNWTIIFKQAENLSHYIKLNM